MIILNIPGVLDLLCLGSNNEKKEILDSSYNLIIKKYEDNNFDIIDHIESQHIAKEDFFESIDYMISFYEQSQFEEFNKCQKLLSMKTYIQEEYSEMFELINA